MKAHIDHEGLVKKYRAEKRKYDGTKGGGLKDSPLLGDRHPHSLLVIEAIQELLHMCGGKYQFQNEIRKDNGDPLDFAGPLNQTRSLPQDYLDELLLRLVPGTDDWYRNHFPVIMETNKSHYFNDLIYDQMNTSEYMFPTLEYGLLITDGGGGPHPFDIKDKLQHLNHIYSKEQLEVLRDKIGKSIYFTHVFTELLKAQDGGQDFKELLELNDPAFAKIKKEFECRLNKLYTHPRLGHLLDSGEIDFAVLNILEQLHKVFRGGRSALDPNHRLATRELRRTDIFQALLDLNIVYKSKYYDMFYMDQAFYGMHVLGPYIQNIREGMSRRDRLNYWLYKRAKGITLGSRYGGFPSIRGFHI